MLLAFDVGNTHTLVGVMRGQDVLTTFRIRTSPRTTDELGELLLALLQRRGVDPASLRAAICSSVVPSQNYAVEKAVRRYLELPWTLVGPGVKTGLRIRTENPRELGSDRIVNAVAARQRVDGAVVVVDFGTATLFDCVSERGEYVGGCIAPGFGVSLDALVQQSARLGHTAIERPANVIGGNTTAALQSGMYFGFVGLTAGILTRVRSELGPCTVLATGEWSSLLADGVPGIDQIVPWLTLEGLALIHQRNPTEPNC